MAQIIKKEYYCNNLEETKTVAVELAKTINLSKVYAFHGDLGAGKTTFIKSILNYFKIPNQEIQSPTFSYLHSYENLECGLNLYHFDLYRINSEKEFLELGFDEYLTDNGICFIEWAERIDTILSQSPTVNIYIYHVDELKRKIEIHNA